MIVEQGVDAVVMLTKLDEPRQRGNYLNTYVLLNVKKIAVLPINIFIFSNSYLDSVNVDQMCARYWPTANGVEEFEHMYIRNLNESNVKTAQDRVLEDLMQRRLEIRCGK